MKTKNKPTPNPLEMEKPRRARRAQTPELLESLQENEDSAVELPDMVGLEIEEKLSVFHGKFGDKDYKIRVERFNKEENEFEIADTLKLEGFDPFSSLKKYGGGRYRLSLLDEGGKYVAGGRMEVRIAQVAADLIAKEEKAPDQGMALLIQSLQAQNTQNLEIVKAALGRPTQEAKGPSLTELIAAMSGLRNLTPKEEGGLGGIKGTLELMKLMKEIMPEPSGESDSGVMSEVSKAVELFSKVGPMINARRSQQSQAAPIKTAAPVNLASGAVVMNPQEAAPAEESPMKPVLDKVQTYIPQLVAWAQRGKDIEEAADFILDEIDNEIVPLIVKNYRPGGIVLNEGLILDQLITKAQDPAQVAAIFEVVPALVPHREWFERVIAKAVEFATTPEDAPAPEANHNV